MDNKFSIKLLSACVIATLLLGCGDDSTNATITPSVVEQENKVAVSGGGIHVYGDSYDKEKFDTLSLNNTQEVLLLDDIETGASYSAMGTKLPQPMTRMMPASTATTTEDTITPELRSRADLYLEYIQDALKNYEGAEINVLSDQVRSNSQSSTINVELSIDFGSRIKSANYVRNTVLKAVNGDNLPAGVSTVDAAMSDKVNLQLTFWQDGNDILLWTGAFIPAEAQNVESKYIDLQTGTALTSSRVLSTDQDQQEFSQNDGNTGGVDILWSIDASGSMGGEQQNLANGAKQFFDDLNKAGVDYRLAVNTQGRNRYRYSCTTLRQTTTGENFIDNKTSNAEVEWSYLAQPGTSDSATETGFYCVREADLTSFDRPTAKNIVVFVSDEPENETFNDDRPAVAGYNYTHRDFNDYKQYFKDSDATYFSIAGTGSLIRPTFDSSVNIYEDKGFNCRGEGGNASGGGHFAEIAKITGGSSASICADSEDWSVMFDRIIETATGLASKFTLAKTPIASTVTVSINGKAVPRDISHENGFDLIYGQRQTSLTFYGTSLPNKGDKIVVDYDYIKSKTVVQ